MRAWLDWRAGSPMLYPSAAKMPWVVAVGFVHLCREWGKDRGEASVRESAHADLMERITARLSQGY